MTSRFSKALVSVVLIFLGGYGLYLLDGHTGGLLSVEALVPLAVVIIGFVSSLYSLRGGMRDVLSSEAFFLGVYLLIRGLISVFNMDLIAFIDGLVILLVGPLMIVFASSLWAGYDHNNIRIRYSCLAILALIFIQILLGSLFAEDFGTIYDLMSDCMLAVMLLTIVVMSMDRSISQESLTQSIRESTESLAVHMFSVDDAYILRNGSQQILDLMDSEKDGQVRLNILSSQMGDRILLLTKQDGQVRMDIHVTGYVHANPLYTRDVRQIVVDDRYMTVYSEDGRWFRLLVFENVQEDFSKAKILGHVIDFHGYRRRYHQFRLLKKNTRGQDRTGEGEQRSA